MTHLQLRKNRLCAIRALLFYVPQFLNYCQLIFHNSKSLYIFDLVRYTVLVVVLMIASNYKFLREQWYIFGFIFFISYSLKLVLKNVLVQRSIKVTDNYTFISNIFILEKKRFCAAIRVRVFLPFLSFS